VCSMLGLINGGVKATVEGTVVAEAETETEVTVGARVGQDQGDEGAGTGVGVEADVIGVEVEVEEGGLEAETEGPAGTGGGAIAENLRDVVDTALDAVTTLETKENEKLQMEGLEEWIILLLCSFSVRRIFV